MRPLTDQNSGEITDDVQIGDLGRQIKGLRRLQRAWFNNNCDTGLYKLMFHLQDQVIDDLEKIICLEVFGLLLSESANRHMERAYRATSKQLVSVMVETNGVKDTKAGNGLGG